MRDKIVLSEADKEIIRKMVVRAQWHLSLIDGCSRKAKPGNRYAGMKKLYRALLDFIKTVNYCDDDLEAMDEVLIVEQDSEQEEIVKKFLKKLEN